MALYLEASDRTREWPFTFAGQAKVRNACV